MTIAILGVDLGKNICSVVGLDLAGAVVLRRRVRCQTLIGMTAGLPACVVAMEACCVRTVSAGSSPARGRRCG